jgi:hypothetical protein
MLMHEDRRHRPGDARAAHRAIETPIAELDRLRIDDRGEIFPALCALEAAYLEDVGEIVLESDREAQAHGRGAVVADHEPLMACRIPQDPRARQMDRALENDDLPALEVVGIRAVGGEHAVVAADVGIEEEGTLAVQAQLVARQEASALVIEAVLAAAGPRDVAIAVEERKALAVLEHAGRIPRARRGGEDVPAVLDADRFVGRRLVLHAAGRTPVGDVIPAPSSVLR